MDPRVAKLKTPQECETFAKNARERGAPQLAEEARQPSSSLNRCVGRTLQIGKMKSTFEVRGGLAVVEDGAHGIGGGAQVCITLHSSSA